MSVPLETLTLEQKASLLSGNDFWSTRELPEAGVPALVLTDGPHGVRKQTASFDSLGIYDSAPATCFPLAVAVASSWDPEVAAAVGAAVGREARALGVHVVLGPGVNIKRSPLCGRNFEYYSEDPLLSGVLGSAHVRAMQAEGVGASVKHFAVNNQETDRMRVSADVDERTLREIYLPAFERIVTEAAPATLMCAYNRVNGEFAAQHRWLLTDVLRGEWGFAGAVMSDWGAVQDPVASVAAGLDLEMPGPRPGHEARIVAAVRAGELDEAAVDLAVGRMLALTGLAAEPAEGFDAGTQHRLARELAARCAVLLRNEGGVLPLRSGQRVVVTGAFATEPRFQGGGSSHLTPTRVDVPLDALREAAPGHGVTVQHAAGADEAVELARGADVAVVFAGLGEGDESEGFDRETLDLPAAQVRLIRAVAAAAPRTVVVLSNGGVVTLEGWHDEVDAVLEGFLLGQAGGGALADLLLGAAVPSGRLAETIPERLADTASHVNFPGEQGHVRYGEGVMVGYRWHETAGRPARYPFGHGLSYTTFETGDLVVEVTGPDTARATVTVTNTGDRAGAEVVQLYVATQAGPVRRPARELRAFAKVTLQPGESRPVTLELDRRAFAYWDVPLARWVVPAGDYTVQAGRDAATVIAAAAVALTGDDVVRPLDAGSTLGEWLADPEAGPALLAELMPSVSPGAGEQPQELRLIAGMPVGRVVEMLGVTLPEGSLERIAGRREPG